jgi:hypothetical protein
MLPPLILMFDAVAYVKLPIISGYGPAVLTLTPTCIIGKMGERPVMETLRLSVRGLLGLSRVIAATLVVYNFRMRCYALLSQLTRVPSSHYTLDFPEPQSFSRA